MGRAGLLTFQTAPTVCVVAGRQADRAIDPTGSSLSDEYATCTLRACFPDSQSTLYVKLANFEPRAMADSLRHAARLMIACDLREARDPCWQCAPVVVGVVEGLSRPEAMEVCLCFVGSVSTDRRVAHDVTKAAAHDFMKLFAASPKIKVSSCDVGLTNN
jgi:hypothetical protein